MKTKHFLIMAVMAIIVDFLPRKAAAQNGQVYAAVEKNGKWGYIDTVGKLQIPFNLDGAGSFSEGIANIKYGGHWGYIDKKGNFKMQPKFGTAEPFHDGRALISYFDNKDSIQYHGYINKGGFLITILQNFENGYEYNDGYVRIRSRNLFGYKDSLDSFVIAPSYYNAGDFYEGKAAVESNGKWGFIDQKGKTLVSPQYNDAYRFENGIAYVRQGKTTSFINAKGEKIFTVDYEEVDVLAQDGMISFRENGKIGFMNKKGKVVIKPMFTGKTLTRFKDGLAPIQGDNGKYGYIDKKGKFVISPQFEDAEFFSNDFASVEIDGKYGFIDRKGNMVIKPEYDLVYEFEPTDVY